MSGLPTIEGLTEKYSQLEIRSTTADLDAYTYFLPDVNTLGRFEIICGLTKKRCHIVHGCTLVHGDENHPNDLTQAKNNPKTRQPPQYSSCQECSTFQTRQSQA
jgi:hypothetical protein